MELLGLSNSPNKQIVQPRPVGEQLKNLVSREECREFFESLYKDAKAHGRPELAQIVYDELTRQLKVGGNKFDIGGAMLMLMMKVQLDALNRRVAHNMALPVDPEKLTGELREAMMIGPLAQIPERLTDVVMKYMTPPKEG